MAQELELKLAVVGVGGDLVASLGSIIPGLKVEPKELKNVYFDTPELDLNANKVALRVRQKGNRFIQTLKTKGIAVNGLHQRGEWEWELTDVQLNEGLLYECEAWSKGIDCSRLVPVFETNFVRQQAEIDWQGSRIELAIDKGEVISGELNEAINELELELVEGSPDAILDLGRCIQERLPVEQSNVSKAERGYALFKSSKSSE